MITRLVAVDGPAKGTRFGLKGTSIAIGRAGREIPLADDTLAERQANLLWVDERQTWILTNQSFESPTLVNGVPVDTVDLKAGDLVKMGETLLVVQQEKATQSTVATPAPVAPPTAAPFFLDVLEGPEHGQTHALTGTKVAIGGSGSAPSTEQAWLNQDLILSDPDVPRQCLALLWSRTQATYKVFRRQDCHFPLFVERREDEVDWVALVDADKPGWLRSGDVLRLGANRLRLRSQAP